MNEHQIYVVKRNGRGKVPLDIEKIHEMVEHAWKISQVYLLQK